MANFRNEPRVDNTNRLTRRVRGRITRSAGPRYSSLGVRPQSGEPRRPERRWSLWPTTPSIITKSHTTYPNARTKAVHVPVMHITRKSAFLHLRVYRCTFSLVRVILYAHVTSPWQLSSTFRSSASSPRFLSFFPVSAFLFPFFLPFSFSFRHAAIVIACYRVTRRQTSWEEPAIEIDVWESCVIECRRCFRERYWYFVPGSWEFSDILWVDVLKEVKRFGGCGCTMKGRERRRWKNEEEKWEEGDVRSWTHLDKNETSYEKGMWICAFDSLIDAWFVIKLNCYRSVW